METLKLIFEILLLVAGVFVVVAVLLQQGKEHGLSGAISGGSETYFGKEKGRSADRRLSKITTVVGAAFVVVVFVLYVLMPDPKQSTTWSGNNWSLSPYQTTEVTEHVDDTLVS